MIERAQRVGVNVIIIWVWHGRCTSWPSELATAELGLRAVRLRSPDPLRYLIDEAHVQGIVVHAWFTVALRQRDFFSEFYDGIGVLGSIDKFFNVHREPFRNFIVNVIDEVVE